MIYPVADEYNLVEEAKAHRQAQENKYKDELSYREFKHNMKRYLEDKKNVRR